MLIQLGKHDSSGDVVALLADCHGRIRRFLVLARELAHAPPAVPPSEIAAAAGQIGRYFAEAFPLHIEDEEVDIAPRIAHDAAVRIHVDHTTHTPAVAELVAICRDLERAPGRLVTRAAELGSLVTRLATELEAHLEFEERVMFPALRRLDDQQQAAIRRAMRARRDVRLRNAS